MKDAAKAKKNRRRMEGKTALEEIMWNSPGFSPA
jgi:hypothetical protein